MKIEMLLDGEEISAFFKQHLVFGFEAKLVPDLFFSQRQKHFP
jgi:hypothetical protein